MSNYRIERVELDSSWRKQIGQVVGGAFGIDPEQTLEAIRRTTATEGPHEAAYFAAYDGDALMGFNAFIAHELVGDAKSLLAYQSCWTATNPAHRGKKVFQNIILEAHRVLASEGAAYVIGWPNANSEPIFVHKLGYRRENSVKRNIFGPTADRAFRFPPKRSSGLRPIDEQLIEIKRRTYGDQLYVCDQGDDLMWGVVKSRATRLGALPYFALGGLRWSGGSSPYQLAKAMKRRLPFVAFWQLISEERNSLNEAIGGFAPSATNPLIWFPLVDGAEGPFDFFGGIRDVF
ncbi:MAG: GNAT family N-acetyltransferase [Tsuneonella sp.]